MHDGLKSKSKYELSFFKMLLSEMRRAWIKQTLYEGMTLDSLLIIIITLCSMKKLDKIFIEAYELLYRYDKKQATRLLDEYHNVIHQDYQESIARINEKYFNKK